MNKVMWKNNTNNMKLANGIEPTFKSLKSWESRCWDKNILVTESFIIQNMAFVFLGGIEWGNFLNNLKNKLNNLLLYYKQKSSGYYVLNR